MENLQAILTVVFVAGAIALVYTIVRKRNDAAQGKGSGGGRRDEH